MYRIHISACTGSHLDLCIKPSDSADEAEAKSTQSRTEGQVRPGARPSLFGCCSRIRAAPTSKPKPYHMQNAYTYVYIYICMYMRIERHNTHMYICVYIYIYMRVHFFYRWGLPLTCYSTCLYSMVQIVMWVPSSAVLRLGLVM